MAGENKLPLTLRAARLGNYLPPVLLLAYYGAGGGGGGGDAPMGPPMTPRKFAPVTNASLETAKNDPVPTKPTPEHRLTPPPGAPPSTAESAPLIWHIDPPSVAANAVSFRGAGVAPCNAERAWKSPAIAEPEDKAMAKTLPNNANFFIAVFLSKTLVIPKFGQAMPPNLLRLHTASSSAHDDIWGTVPYALSASLIKNLTLSRYRAQHFLTHFLT